MSLLNNIRNHLVALSWIIQLDQFHYDDMVVTNLVRVVAIVVTVAIGGIIVKIL